MYPLRIHDLGVVFQDVEIYVYSNGSTISIGYHYLSKLSIYLLIMMVLCVSVLIRCVSLFNI